ncbi:MAG: hypothetical protein R3C28_04520 [Pirellulaceae bacterium]
MQVAQAIFTSVRSGRQRGYHLVSRSPSVNDSTARVLTTWGPSHDSLLDDSPDFRCVNYHEVDDLHVAISKTLHGGPEYSNRGSLQIVTRWLVIKRGDFQQWNNNPAAILDVAITLGLLRLPTDPQAPLNDIPIDFTENLGARYYLDRRDAAFVERLQSSLHRDQRVAVLSPQPSMAVLYELFESIAPDQRSTVSFTTGLRPSLQRPFRLQFLPRADEKVLRQCESHGMVVVDQQQPTWA